MRRYRMSSQTDRKKTDSCHLAGKAARTGWQTNWQRLSGVQYSVRGMCCACLLQSGEAFCCWLACLHGGVLTRFCCRPSASVPFTAGYITALAAGSERRLLRVRQAATGLQVSTNPAGEHGGHDWQQQQRPVMFGGHVHVDVGMLVCAYMWMWRVYFIEAAAVLRHFAAAAAVRLHTQNGLTHTSI
jgi:hypothetical protein